MNNLIKETPAPLYISNVSDKLTILFNYFFTEEAVKIHINAPMTKLCVKVVEPIAYHDNLTSTLLNK